MGRRRRGENERNGYVTIAEDTAIVFAYGQTGVFQREMLITGAEGITLGLFTRMLGWSKSEVDVLVANVRRGLQDPKLHTYTQL